jgi:hypothetical protein
MAIKVHIKLRVVGLILTIGASWGLCLGLFG